MLIKAKGLSNKVSFDDIMKIADVFKNFLPDPKKDLTVSTVSRKGITVTNNAVKDIIKVIKSLEEGGILFKGTSTKITRQEERFLYFFKLLMTANLRFYAFC